MQIIKQRLIRSPMRTIILYCLHFILSLIQFAFVVLRFIYQSTQPIFYSILKQAISNIEIAYMRNTQSNYPLISSLCVLKGESPLLLFIKFLQIQMAEQGEAKNVYRKINKQMKFQFLNRVLAQGQSIYEAAEQIGIHYSTAKTIIFFHKHNHKSYRSFKLEEPAPVVSGTRATYKEISDQDGENNHIKVIYNSHFMKWEARKEVKAGNISLTYLRNSKVGEGRMDLIHKTFKKSNSSSQKQEIKQEKLSSFDMSQSNRQNEESDSDYICNE